MNDVENVFLPVITVKNGLVKTCNEVFTQLFGYTRPEITDCQLRDILMVEAQEQQAQLTIEQLFTDASLSESGVFTTGSLTDQHHYAVPVKIHCQSENGASDTFKLYFRVLENKSIDPITGLPNGWAISSRGNYLLNLPGTAALNLGLIILRVDNFSTINFRHGYNIGDEYLWLLGKKLKTTVGEHCLVVRFSIAKFGVLVEDHQKLSPQAFRLHISQLCQRLCLLAANPMKFSGNVKINKSFSIGISELGADYKSYFAMEIAAETAMHQAQKYSTSKYLFATTQTTNDLLSNKLIIDEFPDAIEQCQIQVYYQPQYELGGGKLIGFEALSRWHHRELGYISPDIFVGIAEDIGLHFEFDLWVFSQVCSQLAEWQRQGLDTPKIAINVSFKTLEMTSFISRIATIIEQTNCPTTLIEIEVTETTSVKNIDNLINNVLKVKKLGIHIAVDDFGSGYSSLSLIRSLNLSLDKLKLDRSLISNICDTTLDREFVRQIIGLGKVLKVKVLAEGIETKEQYQLLQQLGCDYGQGYYFDKALSKQQTEQLIRGNTTDHQELLNI